MYCYILDDRCLSTDKTVVEVILCIPDSVQSEEWLAICTIYINSISIHLRIKSDP